MPTIHTLGAYTIHLYFNDHGEPHFHVRGQGYEAKLLISDGSVVVGSLPVGALRRVRRWAAEEENKAMMMEIWQELSE